MQNITIEKMLNQTVEVFTLDGVLYQGKLVGVDQALNVVLESAKIERSENDKDDEPKTHIIRGDMVCSISLI